MVQHVGATFFVNQNIANCNLVCPIKYINIYIIIYIYVINCEDYYHNDIYHRLGAFYDEASYRSHSVLHIHCTPPALHILL